MLLPAVYASGNIPIGTASRSLNIAVTVNRTRDHMVNLIARRSIISVKNTVRHNRIASQTKHETAAPIHVCYIIYNRTIYELRIAVISIYGTACSSHMIISHQTISHDRMTILFIIQRTAHNRHSCFQRQSFQ